MGNRSHARPVAATWLSVAAATVLAGCTTGSPTVSGSATTPAGDTPTEPATASVPTRAPLPDVLGPTGYGPIALGMSTEQAVATGLLGKPQAYLECTAYPFEGHSDARTGGQVAINPRFGVVIIVAPADAAAHTPEGIGVGSTEPSVTSAYPDLGEGFNGGTITAVPGAANASYRFAFGNGKVSGFGLVSKDDPTCGAS